MVIEGNMTIGMMMAMQYIVGQLNSPIQQFIGFLQSAQDAKLSLERLNEIHGRKDEENASDLKIKDIPNSKDLIIKNILFKYEEPNSEKVLDNITLRIPANNFRFLRIN